MARDWKGGNASTFKTIEASNHCSEERADKDISKVAFLPSVVVTNVKEVDPDKDCIDDDETRRIAAKYGAYILEQRTMIERQVTTTEAAAGPAEETEYTEQ